MTPFGTSQQATTVYDYDEMGNEVAQTDAAGRTTTFAYDALGHRTGRALPGGQSESFGYDLSGNQIYQTNFNGVIITNLYDLGNRLTNQAASSGYNVTFAFSPTGLRTNMVDASGTTLYYYDAMSRLTNKVVTWSNGPTRASNYAYNADSSLKNLWSSSTDGVTNAYQYDLLGRLTNVLANGSVAAVYGYDLVGNLQTLTYGNGVTNFCQYDAMNRLTNQVWNLHGTALANYAYTLGPTGNRTALTETNNSTVRTYGWAYDSMYRLTQEALTGGTSGTINYAYDQVGNRTNRNSSLTVLTNQNFSFTTNDWLASDAYDKNGNTTNSSGNTYQYDALNHATNVNNGGIFLAYDGDGNRARKTVTATGTTTYYLLDDRNPSGYVQVLEEWTATGGTTNLNRVYNYGMGLISQQAPLSSTNYFIFDGHGSTRILVDLGGSVNNLFTYDAYGTLIASNMTSQTTYLYCGQQFDSDLGFYYQRARYLNQNTGRFWTMDTHEGKNEEPQSLHKYLYCSANPVNMIDPTGHDVYIVGITFHQRVIGDDGTGSGCYDIRLDGVRWEPGGKPSFGLMNYITFPIFTGYYLDSAYGPAPIETHHHPYSTAKNFVKNERDWVWDMTKTSTNVDAKLYAKALALDQTYQMYKFPFYTCRQFAAFWIMDARFMMGNYYELTRP